MKRAKQTPRSFKPQVILYPWQKRFIETMLEAAHGRPVISFQRRAGEASVFAEISRLRAGVCQ